MPSDAFPLRLIVIHLNELLELLHTTAHTRHLAVQLLREVSHRLRECHCHLLHVICHLLHVVFQGFHTLSRSGEFVLK